MGGCEMSELTEAMMSKPLLTIDVLKTDEAQAEITKVGTSEVAIGTIESVQRYGTRLIAGCFDSETPWFAPAREGRVH
jgi:hypothetical protein